MFVKTNIEQALSRERAKSLHGNDPLGYDLDTIITSNNTDQLGTKKHPIRFNTFDIDLLERTHIYHLDHIKAICIAYRLRFLDINYFKGEIPIEATNKIQQLEKKHHTKLKNFKIIAPSKLFKLKDKDDPILFVPMGNDYYYFIYKWGNDLHAFRKIAMWPFKNIVNLAFCIFLLSYLLSILVPIGLFSKNTTGYEFWIIFFFVFKAMAAVIIFYGFALGKNFNSAIWNSRYIHF